MGTGFDISSEGGLATVSVNASEVGVASVC